MVANVEKRRLVVFPWKNTNEFNKVYRCIYNGDKDIERSRIESLQSACDSMRIWRVRRSNLTPAGILATLTIVEVQLKDMNGTLEDSVLEILYANAFMRFINFMSSTLQKHNLRSMYDIAKELGLPSFMIDLRHACAHGINLPPLRLLRSTAVQCIDWLEKYYWKKQIESLREAEKFCLIPQDDANAKMYTLVDLFDSCIEVHNMAHEKSSFNSDDFKQTKSKLDEYVRMMIAWLKDNRVNSNLIDKLSLMKLFQKVPKTGVFINSLFALTRSFFYMLSSYDMIMKLLHVLLKMAERETTEDVLKYVAYGFWCEKIADGFRAILKCKHLYHKMLIRDPSTKRINFSLIYTTKLSRKVCQLMILAGYDIKQTLVFGDIRHYPWVWLCQRDFVKYHTTKINEHTAKTCSIIIEICNPELNSKIQRKLKKLINIYISNYLHEGAAASTDSENEI